MKTFGSLILIATLSLTAPGMASEADPVQQQNSNAVWFENWASLSNATLKVVAPNGEVTEVFAAAGTPVFKLSSREAQDGVYRYELSAATKERTKIVNQVDNGRGEAQTDDQAKPFNADGHFTVAGGVIIIPEDIKEEDTKKKKTDDKIKSNEEDG